MDRRTFLIAGPAVAVTAGCVSVGGAAGPPAPAPAVRVGDKWIYDCADGFRVPVTWVETHEVLTIDQTGIAVRVTLVGETMNYNRIELWQAPGIVAIGSIYDDAITRTFVSPLIRYQFPLTPGTDRRQTVKYMNPENQLVSNVQRYVKVGGYESVATPAGTFNALRMRILMSVDDNHPFRFPTECNYDVWWSEEVGARVKEYKYATYIEKGDSMNAVAIRAQNTNIVLTSFSRARG